jgi:hypothetical protein
VARIVGLSNILHAKELRLSAQADRAHGAFIPAGERTGDSVPEAGARVGLRPAPAHGTHEGNRHKLASVEPQHGDYGGVPEAFATDMVLVLGVHFRASLEERFPKRP